MRLIFDENIPKDFVTGFAIIEKANKRDPIKAKLEHVSDVLGHGFTDEEIIEKAKNSHAVIVTLDRDFKKIKHYQKLLQDHRVGYIYFKSPRESYKYWDLVEAFIYSWPNLKKAISEASHPFAFEINKKGEISKLTF